MWSLISIEHGITYELNAKELVTFRIKKRENVVKEVQ